MMNRGGSELVDLNMRTLESSGLFFGKILVKYLGETVLISDSVASMHADFAGSK